MIFQRTPDGSSNLHLFYSVDYVVYSEGGHSPTQDKKYEDLDISYDCSFWSLLFDSFSNKRFRILAGGSKSDLKNRAKFLKENSVKNTLIVMDKDLDDIFDNFLEDKFVLYTYGYSWEVDVLSFNDIRPLFYSICPTCRSAYDPRGDFDIWKSNRASQLRRLAYLDCLTQLHSAQLFDHKKPESIVSYDNDNYPIINKEKLLSVIKLNKKNIDMKNVDFSYKDILIEKHIHGKFYGVFIYRWITIKASKVGSLAKLPKNIFYGMAINCFAEFISGGPTHPVVSHYRNKIKAL